MDVWYYANTHLLEGHVENMNKFVSHSQFINYTQIVELYGEDKYKFSPRFKFQDTSAVEKRAFWSDETPYPLLTDYDGGAKL